MAPIEFLSVIVSRRRVLPFGRRDRVVRLRGEHDQSTVAALSETLARVIALDDADVVVDLSEVQFMGAATVGVIVRARELLRVRERALELRSPSSCAWRVLDLCGCADLLDRQPVDASPLAGSAATMAMAGGGGP